jgi:hypothetical protein
MLAGAVNAAEHEQDRPQLRSPAAGGIIITAKRIGRDHAWNYMHVQALGANTINVLASKMLTR